MTESNKLPLDLPLVYLSHVLLAVTEPKSQTNLSSPFFFTMKLVPIKALELMASVRPMRNSLL